MNTIRVIIAGGRDFRDYRYLKQECDFMLSKLINTNKIEIVSGGANGADKLGEYYAKENEFKLTVMKADWDKHGRSAGYIRNAEMAEYATHVLVFWDGKSRGSKHMIDIANERKLKCRVVEY